MRDTIKQMLQFKKKDLDLFKNERRLVLLAVIKANYNLTKAYEINAPAHMGLEGYIKKFYRYDITMGELKREAHKLVAENRAIKAKTERK